MEIKITRYTTYIKNNNLIHELIYNRNTEDVTNYYLIMEDDEFVEFIGQIGSIQIGKTYKIYIKKEI